MPPCRKSNDHWVNSQKIYALLLLLNIDSSKICWAKRNGWFCEPNYCSYIVRVKEVKVWTRKTGCMGDGLLINVDFDWQYYFELIKLTKFFTHPKKNPVHLRWSWHWFSLTEFAGKSWERFCKKKLYFFRKYKGCVIFGNLLRCCCYFRMSREVKTFLKIVNNGFFSNILFVLVKHCYITLNDVIWRNATALQVKTWNL